MDLFNLYIVLPIELRSIIHYMYHMLIKYDILHLLTKCRIEDCHRRRTPNNYRCQDHMRHCNNYPILSSATIGKISWNALGYSGQPMTKRVTGLIRGYDNAWNDLIPRAIWDNGLYSDFGYVIYFINYDFLDEMNSVNKKRIFDILSEKCPGINWYIRNLYEQKKIYEKEKLNR